METPFLDFHGHLNLCLCDSGPATYSESQSPYLDNSHNMSPILGHLLQRAKLLEKTLTLGKVEGKRRRGAQRIRWLDSISDSMDMSLSKLQEIVKDRDHGVAQSRTRLSDFTFTFHFHALEEDMATHSSVLA